MFKRAKLLTAYLVVLAGLVIAASAFAASSTQPVLIENAGYDFPYYANTKSERVRDAMVNMRYTNNKNKRGNGRRPH